VQGASLLNGLKFDPLTFFQDSLAGVPVANLIRLANSSESGEASVQ
jgi:hypothetical protein